MLHNVFDMVAHKIEIKGKYTIRIAQVSRINEEKLPITEANGYLHLEDGFDTDKITDMSNFKLHISGESGRGKSVSSISFANNTKNALKQGENVIDDMGVSDPASEERIEGVTEDIVIRDIDRVWYKFYMSATDQMEKDFDRDRSGFPPYFNRKNLEERYESLEGIEREIKLESIVEGIKTDNSEG